MKKILLFTLISLALASCKLDGYSEYSMTSISDFEYDTVNFADSIYITAPFYGGSSSYSIVFNSMRENSGDEMTGGCGATMKRDSSIVLKSDNKFPQYTMFATSAANNSDVCAVFYQNDEEGAMPEHDIIFFNNDYGTCSPSYFMLNNTQQTVYDVLSEESSAGFGSGDWVKLTITGLLENSVTGVMEETGNIEFYLADWRGCKDEPDSVLTSWKQVNLSKLGNIHFVDFTIESSVENFTKTFCFDNFVSRVYMKY